ncbi:MAG TPA: hypothetical protein VHE14_01095 [Solirubrobacteraceae bacterium]|nr:hypothetical protein [Solirubrobacteraceae bacterium]
MKLHRFLVPIGTVLLLSALVATSARAGAPALVNVRVEGASSTLLPLTAVMTTTVPPPVTGGPATGTSAAGAIDLATNGNWDRNCFTSTILGETHTYTMQDYWAFWLGRGGGYTYSQTGICQTELQPLDEVLMAVDYNGGPPTRFPLQLAGVPASVQQGTPFTVSVTEYRSDGTTTTAAPAAGATVAGGGGSATTGTNGQATLALSATGTVGLSATAPSRVPAVPAAVCVHNGNDGNCGTSAGSGNTGSGGGAATGSGLTPASPPPTPSQAAIGGGAGGATTGSGLTPASFTPSQPVINGIANGRRFRASHAPRRLSGTVSAGSAGVREVRLRLIRYTSEGGCQYFSQHYGRLRDVACTRGWFAKVSDGADWSLLLPKPLPVGRYELVVASIDNASIEQQARVLFRVT